MTQTVPPPSAPNLASCYQEIFTVTARLRAKKVSLGDSAVFRTQVRQVLQQAESTAAALRYTQDDIRGASFVTTALLDETVLNSSNPAFRDWAQRPLMKDLFETLNAGETCFEHIRTNLNRTESKSVIDLIEVQFLCLALGFRGRFSTGGAEQIRAWRDPMVEKILRFRNCDRVMLSRTWLPVSNVELSKAPNQWTRIVWGSCIGIAALCLILGAVYYLLLARGVSDLAGVTGAH